MYDTPIFQALYDIGLDNLQAQLYYDLLLNPRMTISELAKDYGVHREKIYLASQKLVDIGLATYPKSSKKINIESPSKIYILLKQKKFHFAKTEKDFVDVLPDLLPLYMTEIQKPIVQLYEGIDNFFGVFDQFIEEAKEEILCFANPDYLHQVIQLDYLKPLIQKRILNKVPIRIISSKTNLYDGDLQSNPNDMRTIKYLNNVSNYRGTIYLSGYKIAIFNSTNQRAIQIHDKVVSETFRFMFDSIWNGLGEG
jgi:sugar-specific transcriptional regulator TrmB